MTSILSLRRILASSLSLAFLWLFAQTAVGQTTGDTTDTWADWWFGVFGAANYNSFSGELRGFRDAVEPPSTFESGSALGPALGAVIEYNPGDLLGFTMAVGFDSRPVDFDDVETTVGEDQVTTESLSTSHSFLTIDPALRINLGNRFFHLGLGPTLGFNLGKGFDYSRTDTTGTTTESGDLADVRSFVIGAQGGLGYDIPLTSSDASTQILLTPFAQFHLGFQNMLENPEGADESVTFNDFTVNTIRAGVQLKFGARPASPVVEGPDGEPVVYDFQVDAPLVIAQSRRVEETFPLRNYIFFDPGSTEIPSRYVTLNEPAANAFREENLLRADGSPGPGPAQRSRRQLQVYYNVLNVFGDRLRRDPSSTIRLVGAANGNAAKGKEMAENVKTYLVQNFGIEESRISTEGKAQPPHRSGTGSSQSDDRHLIDAENWRVEIDADPESILMPVEIITLQEEPIGNDVIFRVNGDEDVASVTIEVTDRDGRSETFGPYAGDEDVRLDARQLLDEEDREATYRARTIYTLEDGETYESEVRQFRLVRADPDEEQKGIRYSILFEFDQSKTVKTYEQFLRETVAPSIPNGATVIIHGHTDVIGKPEYNDDLSDKRVDEARRILTDQLTELGRKVTFDSYGFGENEKRAPFDNVNPEHRYYNRTVVIEIVPGG